MKIKSLRELDVKGKTVLVRAGFDVPMENGKIKDDFRISALLPTLNFLGKQKAKAIIISHLGRPKAWNEKFSLEPVARHLSEILNRKLIILGETDKRLPEYSIPHLYFFKHNILKEDLTPLISQMQEGDAVILENLRFYPEEEAGHDDFAKRLASYASCYINDAFSESHRPHASITGIPKFLPAAAGFNLLDEVQALARIINHPRKPLVMIMGGIKLSDKVQALRNLVKLAEQVLLGGSLANLFLFARGFEVGKSVIDKKEINLAKEIDRNYKAKLKLPRDLVVSTNKDGEASSLTLTETKPHHMILDIGPQTIREFSEYMKEAKTMIWNGPLGYFENKTFSHGSYALGRLFASRTKTSVFGVAGGGETLQVLKNLGMRDFVDHLSTGGGAMLDFLAGKTLPGIEALEI